MSQNLILLYTYSSHNFIEASYQIDTICVKNCLYIYYYPCMHKPQQFLWNVQKFAMQIYCYTSSYIIAHTTALTILL